VQRGGDVRETFEHEGEDFAFRIWSLVISCCDSGFGDWAWVLGSEVEAVWLVVGNVRMVCSFRARREQLDS
jgi:predicted nuclease of predicted toxin-antitoxin system